MYQTGFPPSSPLYLQASVDKNDLFDCFENAPNCAPTTSGGVDCSQLAHQVYYDLLNLGFSWETATSRFRETGFIVNNSWGPPIIYFLADDCLIAVPDFSEAAGTMSRTWDDNIGIQAWDMSSYCFSFSSGHQPWYCINPPRVNARWLNDPGRAPSCTYNP